MIICQPTNRGLCLEGELNLANLTEFKSSLQALTPKDLPFYIDLSRLEDLDLAGLQFLLSYLQSQKQESPVRLKGITPLVKHAISLGGMDEAFAPFMDRA